MIALGDWLDAVRVPLEEHWGYIWGTSGEVWTRAKQERAVREMTRLYGERWIGRRVCDCSGLLYRAAKEKGERVHHGSMLLWTEDCVPSTRAPLRGGLRPDGTPPRPGSAVFLMKNEGGGQRAHHVGVYLGGGQTVEAAGTREGVVLSPLSRWHAAAELKCVDHTGWEMMEMTDVKAAVDVRVLQRKLNLLGFDAGTPDGVWGRRTDRAMRAFRESEGLDGDGGADAEALRRMDSRFVPLPVGLAEALRRALEGREEA